MTSETTKCVIVHFVIQFDEGIVQNIFIPFWPYLKCPVRFGTPGTQAIFLFL